ncbi:MAG: aspartate kinase [Neisseriales bacterium]|nr:MAG: aspartate kinase [Neisseriales bacterium]
MTLIVQKYGGTSVGSVERINEVAKRMAWWKSKGHRLVAVVSAMSGETNRLLDLAYQIDTAPNQRELDVVAATGEQVTVGLLAIALQKIGIKAKSYCGWQVPVITDNAHNRARVAKIDETTIRADLKAGYVVVVTGFQGIDENHNITTLGRGGSDTSAVALAVALKAKECQIYTDVDGVYTTDPRIEPHARRLNTITFEEMLEMASLGSKILHPRSVELAGKNHLRLRVLSSFEKDGDGTLITFEEDENMEEAIVSGIAFDNNIMRINVKEVPNKPGSAYQILGPIADANIEVDMIIQNDSNHGVTDFSFTVPRAYGQQAVAILQKLQAKIGASDVNIADQLVKLSIIGVGMRSHCGVAATVFQVLAQQGINIELIATSEIKISVLIDKKYLELAVRVLHKAFKLDAPRS